MPAGALMYGTRSPIARRTCLPLGAALAIAALAETAGAAPSISVQDPLIDRPAASDPDIRQATASSLYFISHADCASDLVLRFPVSISGSSVPPRVFATLTG